MSRKLGQIIVVRENTWMIRVPRGRDPRTKQRSYYNRTVHGSLRLGDSMWWVHRILPDVLFPTRGKREVSFPRTVASSLRPDAERHCPLEWELGFSDRILGRGGEGGKLSRAQQGFYDS